MSRNRPTTPSKCRHHPKRPVSARGVCRTCLKAGYAAIESGEETDESLVEIGFWLASQKVPVDDSAEIIKRMRAEFDGRVKWTCSIPGRILR